MNRLPVSWYSVYKVLHYLLGHVAVNMIMMEFDKPFYFVLYKHYML